MAVLSVVLIAMGWTGSPLAVTDGWAWTQLLTVALFASGLGGYLWDIGASRPGIAVASLWVNLLPFFAVLWFMAYGFIPHIYQIGGGLVVFGGLVYMQWARVQKVRK